MCVPTALKALHEKYSVGKVIFFQCSYIQFSVPPINTQSTALYLCPVLLHSAVTVYLVRSKSAEQ